MIGDAGRRRQVLTKLCKNAVNLTEQGEVEPSIDTLEREPDCMTLEFSVRDTSPAFTPEERETLMAPFAQFTSGGTRRLVVDDHLLARKTAARFPKSFDFDVTVAETGAHAIEMVEEACGRDHPFQFVFMDFLMPGMNGLETAKRLKESVNPKAPGTNCAGYRNDATGICIGDCTS